MIKSTYDLPSDRSHLNDVYVHPTTEVAPDAQIGAGTIIWHFGHVMSTAEVGAECHIGQNVVIQPRASLGNRCRVLNNVTLFKGVHCADEVFLGPSCVFTNVLNPRAFINRKAEIRPTYLKQGVTVGANATILCGITIGAYAMIGAGSVVLESVPEYALVVGNPAKQVGWVSRDGHRLHFQAGRAYCKEENRWYLLNETEGYVSPL